MVHQDVAIAVDRAGKVTLQPRPGGRSMSTLTIVGATSQRLDRLHALRQHRHRATVGGHDSQAGPQAMPHRKRRIGVEHLLDRRQRVELVAQRQIERLLVLLQGTTAGGRGRAAAGVGEHDFSGRVNAGATVGSAREAMVSTVVKNT
jgi:hypothetical protein